MSGDTVSTIETAELTIAALYPTAADMIATTLANNPPDFDVYASFMEVAEAESPLLLCAVLRLAAGLAAICDMAPEDLRQLPAALAGKPPASIPT